MVSVIIRNHNEHQYIGFAIQSVLDFIPNAQIIVIDDHSTDDSLDVVKLFTNRGDIKVITIDDYTPGKAINLGVQHSKYDTILVLSAHSQIVKLDLEYVEYKLKTYAAIFGKQTPIYRGKKISKRYIWSHFLPGKEDRYWASDILKVGKSYLYTPTIGVNHYYTVNGATWKGIG